MTAVYGVFGWPVAHSRSPAMHNAAFSALGLEAIYVPYAVAPDNLPSATRALVELEIAGVNVTVPHKSAIMPLLTAIDPAARAIGAVNTVLREGSELHGSNTDAEGLARALREADVALDAAELVVLGAGGAARAAVVGLARAGAARITVAARRESEARALVAGLRSVAAPCELAASDLGPLLVAACARASLLIQATSAGFGDSTLAERFAASLPLAALPDHAWVCDLVYKPLRTAVLARAEARGLRTLDGLGMLLHQGALAFERWTAKPAPLAAMRAALRSSL